MRGSGGADRGMGNVVAIQPRFRSWDFRGPVEFMAAVQPALESALASDWIRPETVLVFPERVGLYFALAEEWPGVYAAGTLVAGAARALGASPLLWPGWVRRAAQDGTAVGTVRALLAARAARARQIEQEVFGGLAARYRAAVVAGSGVTGPLAVEGRVYGPSGAVLLAYGKRGLDEFEQEVLGARPAAGGPFRFAHGGTEFEVVLGGDVAEGSQYVLNPCAGQRSPSQAVTSRLAGHLWGQTYSGAPEEPPVANVWL